jgi:hypothetical protein
MDSKKLQLIRADSENPERIEALLEKLARQEPVLFAYLLKKLELQKARIGAESHESWFSCLSWWFARLLMYGSLLGAFLGLQIFGGTAVSPVSWALAGAAAYYLLIQLFTPYRLRRDSSLLLRSDSEKKDLVEFFDQQETIDK